MNEFFFSMDYDKPVTIKPVLCADGFWRWCVTSFKDIDENTPAFTQHNNPVALYVQTDGYTNPENYGD